MQHIFVSYKREDRAFVDELERKILAANLTVWTDSHILPGENWEESIDNAIKNAFALVLVMTPAARSSEYVTYEWSFAMGMGVPIIPILLIQTDVHPKLSRVQNLNFTNRYGEPWDTLLKRLETLKSSPKKPALKSTPVDDSISNFLDELMSPNYATAISAIETLGMMNATDAVPALIHILSNPVYEWENQTIEVQETALTALAEIGDPRALAHLVRYATQGNEAAILALAKFPEDAAARKTLIRIYEKFNNGSQKSSSLIAMTKILEQKQVEDFNPTFRDALRLDKVDEIRRQFSEVGTTDAGDFVKNYGVKKSELFGRNLWSFRALWLDNKNFGSWLAPLMRTKSDIGQSLLQYERWFTEINEFTDALVNKVLEEQAKNQSDQAM